MLFGAAKRLATVPRSLEIKYRDKIINATTYYKCLSVKLDSTVIIMQEYSDSTFKQASS